MAGLLNERREKKQLPRVPKLFLKYFFLVIGMTFIGPTLGNLLRSYQISISGHTFLRCYKVSPLGDHNLSKKGMTLKHEECVARMTCLYKNNGAVSCVGENV